MDCEATMPPSQVALYQACFIQHIRKASVQERAGGYKDTISYCRAMQKGMVWLSLGAVKSKMGPIDREDIFSGCSSGSKRQQGDKADTRK